MSKEFQRKTKENRPVIAICYDFDKTLSPDDMQAQGYIQSVNYDIPQFWEESNGLAQNNDMDQNLAYMYTMIEKAHGKVLFTRENLLEYGSKVQLFDGVEKWFDRINKYGVDNEVIIEHYIISSGLKEMIEGTSIAKYFEKIYASSFYYDINHVAKWPAQVVNYTNKTQFLFRIEKGVLDVNDSGVNDYFKPEDVRIPFRNIIYIGDSDTDIPCMKLVNSLGGHSIGVYNDNTMDKTKVHKMLKENRIKYFTPADYNINSELDNLVKTIIERTNINEVLESKYYACKKEADIANDENVKFEMIMKLTNSSSFAMTHTIVAEMYTFSGNWTDEEMDMIFKAAFNNSQVQYILKDMDIKRFFDKLLSKLSTPSEHSEKVKDILSN